METLNSAALQHCNTFGNDDCLTNSIVIMTTTSSSHNDGSSIHSTNLLGVRYSACYVFSFNFHNSMR